jgi:transcriptional regulator with XRE-family HTH domain
MIESGQREISLSALEKIARFFNISLDELVYMDGELPQEVEIEDKTAMDRSYSSCRNSTRTSVP